jgi:hypothetical protein
MDEVQKHSNFDVTETALINNPKINQSVLLLCWQSIMRNLVRRYVTVEQRKAEGEGVTEDDVNEIKQDISAFRCELIEILKNSGMNTSTASGTGTGKASGTTGIISV